MSSEIWSCRVDSRKALKLFLKKISFLQVDLDIKYTMLNVGQVINGMTRGSYIPTDSVKSGGDCSNLVHSIGTGAYIDSDKTI